MTTILHLIPTLEGGGSERQLSMLAAEQVSRGWKVHVALRRGGVNEDRMRGRGVSIHPLGDLKGVHPLLLARTANLVRRFRPAILQTWLPQMDLVGGVLALCSAVPWVLSERSVETAYQNAFTSAWIRPRLKKFTKAVVANSIEGADYWIHIPPTDVYVTTVSNAVDIAAIRGAEPMSCQRPEDSRKILLFVGRLLQVKAPDVFLEAIRYLRDRQDFHALLIGEGQLRKELCARIISDGLGKHVSVLPYQAEWWGLLKTATALVSTSRYEGQPSVVLEAMAAGCPLVVSDIAAHRSMLDERSALLVPPDNPAALADAIVSLLSHPEAARQRAEMATARAADYSIQAAADAYEQVYARILDGRRI